MAPPCRSSLRVVRSSAVRFNPYSFFPTAHYPPPITCRSPRLGPACRHATAQELHGTPPGGAAPGRRLLWLAHGRRDDRGAHGRVRVAAAGVPRRRWIHAPRRPWIHRARGTQPLGVDGANAGLPCRWTAPAARRWAGLAGGASDARGSSTPTTASWWPRAPAARRLAATAVAQHSRRAMLGLWPQPRLPSAVSVNKNTV